MRANDSITHPDRLNSFPNQVFFSYAREDQDAVIAYRAAAIAADVIIWMDTQDLALATPWETEIEHAIARSDLFVAFVTENLLRSAACRLELEHAEKLHKRILPVIDPAVRDDEAPALLGKFQWVRAPIQAESGTGIRDVVAALRVALKANPELLRSHTDLSSRARQWTAADKDASLVLHDRELMRARELLARQGAPDGMCLGDEALELIAVSERQASKRRIRQLAAATMLVIILSVLGVLTFNASLEADANQVRSVRSQLNQLAASGDYEAVVELAATYDEVVSTDALSALQVHLALGQRVESVHELTAMDAYWVSVRGPVVLISGDVFGSSIISVADWSEPERLAAPFDEAQFDVSFNGAYVAAWSAKQLAIKALREADFRHGDELSGSIEHVTVHDAGKLVLVTTRAGLTGYALQDRKLGKIVFELSGCDFVAWATQDHFLALCAGASQPGYWLVQVSPYNGSMLRRLHVSAPLGELTQVILNQTGILILGTASWAHAFQLPWEAPSDSKPQLTDGAVRNLGRLPTPVDAGLALANGSAIVSSLDDSGDIKILSLGDMRRSKGAIGGRRQKHPDDDFERQLERRALRAGGWMTGHRLPMFDANDEHILVPGASNKVVSVASGKVVTHIEGEGSTTSGTGDDAFFRVGSTLIGLSLIHGGRGEISLRKYSAPRSLTLKKSHSFAFSLGANGETFELESEGKLIRTALDVGTQKVTALGGFPRGPAAAAISRSGNRVITLTRDHQLMSWDLASPNKPAWVRRLNDVEELNTRLPLSISEDEEDVVIVGRYRSWVVGARDGVVRCGFDRTDGPYVGMASFFRPGLLSVTSMHFTNGTGWEVRELSLVRTSDCKTDMSYGSDSEGTDGVAGFGLGVQLDASGKGWIADRKVGTRFAIQEVNRPSPIGNISGHEERVLTLLVRDELGLLISADELGVVSLWEKDSFRLINRFDSVGCPVVASQMSANGRFLAVICATEGKATIWDLGDYGSLVGKAGWRRLTTSWYLKAIAAFVPSAGAEQK